MEDTRKLLAGIGQPDFAYRHFDDDAVRAAAARWPLMRVVAQAAGLWRTPAARAGDAASTAFLGQYGRGAPPPATPRTDLRSLLDRLGRDDR